MKRGRIEGIVKYTRSKDQNNRHAMDLNPWHLVSKTSSSLAKVDRDGADRSSQYRIAQYVMSIKLFAIVNLANNAKHSIAALIRPGICAPGAYALQRNE